MIQAIAAMSAVLSDLESIASAATAPSAMRPAASLAGTDETAAPSFTQALQGALSRVDHTIAGANAAAKAFSAGDQNVPLSDVMVSLEQANLALQMASAVRDKVVTAYTNIMNMPV